VLWALRRYFGWDLLAIQTACVSRCSNQPRTTQIVHTLLNTITKRPFDASSPSPFLPPSLSLSSKTATSNTPPPSLPPPLSLHIHTYPYHPSPLTPPPPSSNSITPPPRPPAPLSPQQLPCLLRDRLPPLPVLHASRPPDFPSLFLHIGHHLVLGVRVPAFGGLAPSAHGSVSRL